MLSLHCGITESLVVAYELLSCVKFSLSSLTRGGRSPALGARSLGHWTTREVLIVCFLLWRSSHCRQVYQIGTVGLSWWSSGWESASQCRGHGFNPWSRDIPHTADQLSLCVLTTEPKLWSLCSATREATTMRSLRITTKSNPCSLQLEKTCEQQQRPSTANKNHIVHLKLIIVLPVVRVPGRERRLLETMQLAIGEFITDSSPGLPPSPRV